MTYVAHENRISSSHGSRGAGALPSENVHREIHLSRDAKVIAVQYSSRRSRWGWWHWCCRISAAADSCTSSFITPSTYLQYVTMHGMIMVIYLLTALFLGGFGNYLIPLMVGARDMVFPYVNMVSFWVYLSPCCC